MRYKVMTLNEEGLWETLFTDLKLCPTKGVALALDAVGVTYKVVDAEDNIIMDNYIEDPKMREIHKTISRMRERLGT